MMMNLATAVASNDLALVQELCRAGQDPNQTFACSPRQSAYAVQPIMGRQAENFEPDDILYGATPLNLAVLNGNEDIVRVLIDAGADLNKKDGRGRTPLLCAVYGLDTLTITPANLALISQTSPAHLSILRNCILPHPSITLSTLNAPQDEIKGITPLCLASYLGKEVVVKCLLEAGKVDVDATDRKGATALMYAARDRHMAVVTTLLRHGASPDQTDSNGWSSIQYGQMYPEIVQMFEETLRCKRPEVLHLLTPPESPQPIRSTVSALDRSADGSNNTALPYALSQSLVRYPLYYSKLSSLLSSLPAAQTITSKDGTLTLQQSTPTANAGPKSSSEIALAQQIQRTTHTALLEAIKLGDFMSLQSLLMSPPTLNENGRSAAAGGGGGGTPNVALVNHHDPQTGLTPLHHALRTRPLPSMETVKILYQAGADMNAQSHYGRTALHHLCRFSLEHALSPIIDDAQTAAHNSQAMATASANGANVATNIEESRAHRRKNRHRTDTNGSAGSNHLTPNGKEQPGSSAASTTSSNDLSTGPRHPHGTLIDTGAVKTASPEEIQRASKHLADCCRLLLRLGSLVNIADRHGNTPLHFAVEYGGVLEVVSVLVKEGADIEQRNTKGLKPLDVVRGEQSEEMRRILESGRQQASGESTEPGSSVAKAVVPAYQARDSILKPLNLPETLHEVDFQFNQVLQNLEHYQNHTSGANGQVQSQEEYNADLVSSLENLKFELESTYELLMITEEQYKDVITFYETELDEMTRQNLTVLTSYDSEKSKVSGLYGIYTRLIEQLEELEAENEGLKTELEEKKRRGLVSLGRLVNGAMGGSWSGTRNGSTISLAKTKAALIKKNNEKSSLVTTALDEEHLIEDSDGRLDGLPRPNMVFASPAALSIDTAKADHDSHVRHEEKELNIPRPISPTHTAHTILSSTEEEPTMHTIAVLSQKVSLLEQELSSKTCDIKERDLLVSELTDLIEEQSKAFGEEIKSREERIDSLMKILGRAEEGEQVQSLVDELAVKIMVQEDEQIKRQRLASGIVTPNGASQGDSSSVTGPVAADWSFVLKASASKPLADQGEQDMVATLKHELELSKAQTARLELANDSLKERWQQAMHELEGVRQSEAANSDLQNGGDANGAGAGGAGRASTDGNDWATASSLITRPRTTKVYVSKTPHNPQDEPLFITIDENGNPQEEFPSLEEIELVFEILMANLAEISRDAEEADARLQECSRAKEQIYRKCLYLDGLQKTLDENVEKIVSQPFKADTQPNFMKEQLKLQNQLNELMDQAESVTTYYNKLKKDLQDYKEEKQSKLKDLDRVRELMRKIGPQELLRGLLVKLEGSQPDDAAAERRREAIAAAVAQGMELAAELAAEEDNANAERASSQLWRNSCSVIDEGDDQEAIDSRLSTASIDHYTQSCSISDHKLFIQSLCSTLYALQMTTTHQIVSLKTSLAESRASLVLADQELSNLNDQIAGLYDEVGTLRNQLRGLQQELDRLIQHRKAEVEKVWEIVGEVKITGGGLNKALDDDDEGSVSSADTARKSSIQSRALATSSRYSTALGGSGLGQGEGNGDSTGTLVNSISDGNGVGGNGGGPKAGGDRDSVARSLSISRAERASVLRRVSSPPTLPENDEDNFSTPPSRASYEYSDRGSMGGASELDRHALISAEMDKLRSVHLHLLSTITEYKKQITVVKDRNLKLVATLLDRERVRLWTADGQDKVISAIVGQHGGGHSSHSQLTNGASPSVAQSAHSGGGSANTVGAVSMGESYVAPPGSNSNGGLTGSSSTNHLHPGVAAGTKKHHHLSLTAAEDGIKLLRCQLERIRQCEMTRFAEMGVGLTMNYSSLYPGGVVIAGNGGPEGVSGGAGGVTGAEGTLMPPAIGGRASGKNGESTFSRFEATLYSDLENRYGA
ncbi:hypothetical protein BG015_007688 [Linnemannia schmuckeri]|uniref:Ankyrin repeat protein n=1 Tax=Linnemannia schmuckeri TaxID=64567 RepID=A0A9P5S616_9FUNG|nr:hypothetical protein BG015_007688 [Linnemannia schmuckeri]